MEEHSGGRGPKLAFITGVAVIVAVALSFLLSWIELRFDLALYAFTGWYILPIGGLCCGLLAAGGYVMAARLLHVRPGPIDGLVLPVVLGVGTFFLTNWLTWFRFDEFGVILRENVGFVEYLKLLITESGMESTDGFGDIDRLGNFGYVVTALQVVGFALGGWLSAGWLRSFPFCERSGRYMKRTGSMTRHFKDDAVFGQAGEQAISSATAGDLDGLRQLMESDPQKSFNSKMRIVATFYRCERAGEERAVVQVRVRKGSNAWKQVAETPTNPPVTVAHDMREPLSV